MDRRSSTPLVLSVLDQISEKLSGLLRAAATRDWPAFKPQGGQSFINTVFDS